VVLKPLWRDQPVLALMISETVIWAAIFYSFPALVLLWQGEYGWSATTTLGAFSVALAVQGLAAPHMGRIIDRGGAPRAMTLGTVGALLGLAALTQVTVLWQFYTVWAWLGLMMAATLYDAAFSIVTRARGARARAAITAITLAAGLRLDTGLSADGHGRGLGRLARAIWVLAALVLVVVLPLHRSPPRGWRPRRRPATPPAWCRRPVTGAMARPGFWPLGLGFALTALGAAILLTNLLPLMAALGVPGTSPSSPPRSSGPRRSWAASC
jgi:MFS family permease